MAGYINKFISEHTDILWQAELAEFGRTVNYWPGGDQLQSKPVQVIWIEGTADEETSPGRYSHAKVRNGDLPIAPALGDALEKSGAIFDVVRVNALAIYFAVIILQERI